jgi:hypothetical protein
VTAVNSAQSEIVSSEKRRRQKSKEIDTVSKEEYYHHFYVLSLSVFLKRSRFAIEMGRNEKQSHESFIFHITPHIFVVFLFHSRLPCLSTS